MSEHSTPEERTEMPTDKRMGEYRKHGQVHLSTEVVQVLSLLSGFLVLFAIAGWIFHDMEQYIIDIYARIARNEAFTKFYIYEIATDAFRRFAPHVAAIAVTISTVATLAVMLQTNWNVKDKKIEMKWSSLNPISGIKKVFSINGLVNTMKSLFKLMLILPIGYFALKRFAPDMVGLIHTSIEMIIQYIGESIFYVFWKVIYVLIAFAIFDYFWSRYQWFRQNKMTKEEVKDERKSIEGDEKTKRQMQQKGLQRIMERIQQSVPQADVIITNPTHYAVALKYDRETMSAPVVVAKGKGFIALRIREIAKEAGVPILERKPLARALYAATEVGSQIPHELFKAVAEILAYVYRLKHPHRYVTQGA